MDRLLLRQSSNAPSLVAHATTSFGCQPRCYYVPGHFSADFVLTIVDALESGEIEVEPPFLVVAERRGLNVRIPLRAVASTE
jgi:hypothetical protein